MSNSSVQYNPSLKSCQAHVDVASSGNGVFECHAPSSDGVSGSIDYPCLVKKKYGAGEFKSVFVDGRLCSHFSAYDGSLCHGCQWAVFVDGDSPFTCPNNGVTDATFDRNFSYKRRRFYVRSFRGAMCGIAKGYRFRWFVLTESDEALLQGIDFGKEFHRFTTWLKKVHCKDFQYEVVEHRQGGISKVTLEQRRNWHIISYGSDWLPVMKMREYWLGHFKSTITGMAEVKNIDKAIVYLASYLGDKEKFVRSWSSQGWVYRGWIGDTKKYHSRFGVYPDKDVLCKLSLMSPVEREYSRMCMSETGYLSLEECM